MSARAPSALSATFTLARLTARRALRDRSTWLLVAIALMPVAFILLLGPKWSPEIAWIRVVNVSLIPLFAILPPMALAPLIAEEASAQTYSYLWSRPIPRWSVLAGKALALTPLVIALLLIAGTLAYSISGIGDTSRLASLTAAIVIGTLACGSLSAALGVFLHKHAVAVAAGYLLVVDLPVGAMKFSVQNISITHHIRGIAGTGREPETFLFHAVWLVAMTTVFVTVMMWRVRRIELSAAS